MLKVLLKEMFHASVCMLGITVLIFSCYKSKVSVQDHKFIHIDRNDHTEEQKQAALFIFTHMNEERPGVMKVKR